MKYRYWIQLFVAFDQLVNTVFNGWADETISARAWRKRNDSRHWGAFRLFIDALFYPIQRDHCLKAYRDEQLRLQGPADYRAQFYAGYARNR